MQRDIGLLTNKKNHNTEPCQVWNTEYKSIYITEYICTYIAIPFKYTHWAISTTNTSTHNTNKYKRVFFLFKNDFVCVMVISGSHLTFNYFLH